MTKKNHEKEIMIKESKRKKKNRIGKMKEERETKERQQKNTMQIKES